MKARDIKKYLDQFNRPSNISPERWAKMKSWAYAAHAGAVKGLHWSYRVEIICPEQLEMFKNAEGKFLIPVSCLKVVNNSAMSGFFRTLLNQAVMLMENGLFDEADDCLTECELFVPFSQVVFEKRNAMFRLAAGEKLNGEEVSEKPLLKIGRPKLYELRSRARAV